MNSMSDQIDTYLIQIESMYPSFCISANEIRYINLLIRIDVKQLLHEPR